MKASKAAFAVFAFFILLIEIGYITAYAYYRGSGNNNITDVLTVPLILNTLLMVYAIIAAFVINDVE